MTEYASKTGQLMTMGMRRKIAVNSRRLHREAGLHDLRINFNRILKRTTPPLYIEFDFTSNWPFEFEFRCLQDYFGEDWDRILSLRGLKVSM